MIRKTYLSFYYTLLLSIALVLLLIFALTRQETAAYLAEHVLKPLGVGYSSFEGSLMRGFIIRDLSYGEGIQVKKVELRYTVAKLIRRVPQFDLLALDSPVIITEKLETSGEELSIPAFALSSFVLKEAELLMEDPLSLNLKAKGVRYDNGWMVEQVDAQGTLAQDAPLTVALHARTLAYDKALSVAKLDATGRMQFETGELNVTALKARGLRYEQAWSALSVETVADLSLLNDGVYTIEFNGERVSYDTALSVEMLDAKANTPYGRAMAIGTVDSNRVLAKTTLMPRQQMIEKYAGFLEGVPQVLECDIEAGLEAITVSLPLERVSLKADENLSVQDAAVTLTYRMENDSVSFNTRYTLAYGAYSALAEQNGTVDFLGAYATQLELSQLSHPVDLPFNALLARISGDSETMTADITAGPLQLGITGKDYDVFSLSAKSEQLAFSFLQEGPDLLRKNVLSFDANATLNLTAFSLEGNLNSEGSYMATQGHFTLEEGRILYTATVWPNPESELFEGVPVEKFSPFKLLFHRYQHSDIFYLDSNLLKTTLFKSGSKVTGWGELGSSRFDLSGRIEESGEGDVVLRSSTASLRELLEQFSLGEFDDIEFFDAGIDLEATLSLHERMHLKGRIDIPWYVVNPDSQRSFTGKENFVEVVLEGPQLSLERYRFDVIDHSVYSDKPSTLSMDENGTLHFEEMRLYDELVLRGELKLPEMQGALTLKSDRFTYVGKEGNVTARADITARFDGPQSQAFEGEIVLMDGVIRYAPPKEYAIHDDDVVIIQDMKLPSQVKRFINIKIASEKPLLYENEGVAVRFSPDFVIWQEKKKFPELLGMLTIEGGKVNAGEKEFNVGKGEIYFYGEHPIDPYLNLLLRYSVEERDFEIHIANTLESPVILFSSTPAMSQNDIISYLLFGAPATTAFESSGDGADVTSVGGVLLGTGLKTMFNEATGIKVDTLNILTGKEGMLGYEVGAQLSGKIRLLYKSETTSSLILQYSVNRWVRVDVDVYETGQGVSLLYVKDFGDPLK